MHQQTQTFVVSLGLLQNAVTEILNLPENSYSQHPRCQEPGCAVEDARKALAQYDTDKKHPQSHAFHVVQLHDVLGNLLMETTSWGMMDRGRAVWNGTRTSYQRAVYMSCAIVFVQGDFWPGGSPASVLKTVRPYKPKKYSGKPMAVPQQLPLRQELSHDK